MPTPPAAYYVKRITAELYKLEEWMDGLTELERTNFITFIGLPNVYELLAKAQEGQFKEMAIRALAFKEAGSSGR